MSTRTPARVSGPIFFVLPLAVHLMALPLAGQIKPDDDEGDENPPIVTITPASGTWTDPGPVQVTIHWCDDVWLEASSREIKFQNADVTSEFTYTILEQNGSCLQEAESVGEVTLDPGGNTLTASISDGVNTGNGSAGYNYDAEVAPTVSVAFWHTDDIRSQGMCAACFDQVYSYTTPAYVSLDAAQAVTLYYSSDQAAPRALVAFDAWNPANNPNPPETMSISLQRGDGSAVTFTDGSTELFYEYPDTTGTAIRLSAQFDASSLASGAYGYTATIRSWWPNDTTEESTQPVRVVVQNEKDSKVAPGWTIAGAQTLIPQGDSLVVLLDGAGTAIVFEEVATDTFEAPRSDFTRIHKTGSGEYWRAGGDSVKYYYSQTADLRVRLDSIVDRFGNAVEYEYDLEGRLEKVTDPIGKSTTIEYSSSWDGIEEIQTPGPASRWIYFTGSVTTRDLLEIEDPDGGTRSFTYDGDHRMESVTDREGSTTDLTYDVWGKLSRVELAQVELFDGSNVRPSILLESPEMRALPLDASGQPTDSSASVRPDSIYGLTVGPRGDTTRAWYNGFGQPTKVEDPVGRVSTFGYTGHGQTSVMETPAGGRTELSWDDERLTSNKVVGHGTRYYYYDADWENQLVEVKVWNRRQFKNYLGPLGTVDSAQVGDFGANKAYFYYDSRGRDSVHVDMEGNETQFFYEGGAYSSENLWKVVREGGGTTTREFDENGRPWMTISPLGDTTLAFWDDLNRDTAVYDPVNPSPTKTHYGSIYADSLTNAKGEVHRFVYNALGWVTEEYGPASDTVADEYGFDAAGNLVEWTNRNGQTIEYEYDVAGRITKITAPDDTLELGYDPTGQDRFAWVKNEWSTDTTWYTAQGLVDSVKSVRADGGAVYGLGYEYGHWSAQPTELYDGYNDRTLKFGFDKQGKPDTLWVDGAKTWVDTRNANRFVTTRRYEDATLRQEQSYTAVNRRAEIAWKEDPSGDLILSKLYGFDEADRITDVDPSGEKKLSYEYDDLHRLTKVLEYEQTQECTFQPPYYLDCSGTSETLVDSAVYTYDEVGNRTDGSASIDPGSRLRSQDITGATVSYDYDAAGNVIRREIDLSSGTDTVQDLYWGALGQLDSVRITAGAWENVVRYRYDGFGQKIAQLSEADTVEYAWADGHVLFEVRNGTTTEFSYLPGVDRPHTMVRHDTTYYYLTDHLGSVLAVTDSTGDLRARYEYDEWGEREVLYDYIGQSCGFTGREYDPETGYYYMRARFYDARTGRFLSEDPVGLASGLNPYAYAANNPLTFRDPTGLDEEDSEDDKDEGGNVCDLATGEGCVVITKYKPIVAYGYRSGGMVGGDWLGFNGGRNPGRGPGFLTSGAGSGSSDGGDQNDNTKDCLIAVGQTVALGILDFGFAVTGFTAGKIAARGLVTVGKAAFTRFLGSTLRTSSAGLASRGLPVGFLSREAGRVASTQLDAGRGFVLLGEATAIKGSQQLGILGGVLGDRPLTVSRVAEFAFPSYKAGRRAVRVCF